MIDNELIKRIVSLTPGVALYFKYLNEDYRIWRDSFDHDGIYFINILKITSFGSIIGSRTAFKIQPSDLSVECIRDYVKLLNVAEIQEN